MVTDQADDLLNSLKPCSVPFSTYGRTKSSVLLSHLRPQTPRTGAVLALRNRHGRTEGGQLQSSAQVV